MAAEEGDGGAHGDAVGEAPGRSAHAGVGSGRGGGGAPGPGQRRRQESDTGYAHRPKKKLEQRKTLEKNSKKSTFSRTITKCINPYKSEYNNKF